MPAVFAARFGPAAYRSDALFEDELAPARAAVESRQQDRAADGRMARERKLGRGREDADPGAVRGVCRRRNGNR
jgi:hypothetical protein